MDLIGEERGRLARAATWLDATRVEALGLAVLLVGAVVATGATVWVALGRPAQLPAEPGAASTAVDAGLAPGPATVPTDEPHDTHLDDHAADGPTDGEVVVHVTGAVVAPGVVTLAAGSRVADAVEAAGGLTDDADPGSLNLARPVIDGERVLVLREGEEPPPDVPDDPGAPASSGPVDLNRATVAELETLPGIGPALAQRIVTHRETHGPFRAPGDLRDVSGIGEKRFQDLAPLVTVG